MLIIKIRHRMEIKFTKGTTFNKGTDKPIRLFKVNPLDINLEKMQIKLKQRCEMEVSEYGDFAPITEGYTISPNYQCEVFADEIELVCKKSDRDKKQILLEAVVTDVSRTSETHCIIDEGTKEEILEMLNDFGLFLDMKNDILLICEDFKKRTWK